MFLTLIQGIPQGLKSIIIYLLNGNFKNANMKELI